MTFSDPRIEPLLSEYVANPLRFFTNRGAERLFEVISEMDRNIATTQVSLTHWLTDEDTPQWLKQQMENLQIAITPEEV